MGCWRVGIVTVQFWLCLKQQITRIKTPFFFFFVNRKFREFILGCYFKAVNGLCADTIICTVLALLETTNNKN